MALAICKYWKTTALNFSWKLVVQKEINSYGI
jgi:alanyl-tRNA synthetase